MTQPMTPAVLNLALAGLIGVDLTARGPKDPLYTYSIDTESGHITYSHELTPPDWSGDIVTAFTLGEVMRARDLGGGSAMTLRAYELSIHRDDGNAIVFASTVKEAKNMSHPIWDHCDDWTDRRAKRAPLFDDATQPVPKVSEYLSRGWLNVRETPPNDHTTRTNQG